MFLFLGTPTYLACCSVCILCYVCLFVCPILECVLPRFMYPNCVKLALATITQPGPRSVYTSSLLHCPLSRQRVTGKHTGTLAKPCCG